ncbi:MAG: TIGR04283 family arsenosugar biosynthesis glycosyltransferase [Proteobacteria bacterium]|nr:TIGR04283 family arsenosugar biosynthesis glycosyltransferase [Pseudomonadota bacterium]
MSLAVVIPVLNDVVPLTRLLDEIVRPELMVVIADGGSTDGSRELAAQHNIPFITSRPGRGYQLSAGAAVAIAQGAQIIWIVHADTSLCSSAVQIMVNLQGTQPHWGRFDIRLLADGWLYRMIETMMNIRSRLSGIATGDQAIYIHADLLDRIGGVPCQALMEDIELSRRLRRLQKPACHRAVVGTSARRWQRHGVGRTIGRMWWYRARYFFGADPDDLYREYYR